MGMTCKDYLLDELHLFAKLFGKVGVAMSMNIHPPARYSIKYSITFFVNIITAFGLFNFYGICCGFFLGIRSPYCLFHFRFPLQRLAISLTISGVSSSNHGMLASIGTPVFLTRKVSNSLFSLPLKIIPLIGRLF